MLLGELQQAADNERVKITRLIVPDHGTIRICERSE